VLACVGMGSRCRLLQSLEKSGIEEVGEGCCLDDLVVKMIR